MSDKIFQLIKAEEQRQKEMIALIPSENYVSEAVRQAVGSVLMNKYAEGKVNARYYQGNELVDQVEGLCQQRALAAFGLKDTAWGVNVQPHSGCPANLAVYNALLKPGDKIMAMSLPHGGHLSHGWHTASRKVTLVSKIFQIEFYQVDPQTQVFDYQQLARQARKYKPQLLISGGTAYPREIDHQQMGEIARLVGAYYLADVSHEAGLIAAGVNSSPFADADVVTMTTHKTLRGPRGAMIFAKKQERAGQTRQISQTHRTSQLNQTASQDLVALVDSSVFPGLQGGPHLHSIAGIAVALREAQSAAFKNYAKQVVKNAQLIAKILLDNDFEVVTSGTDKHLVLVDLRNLKVSGWVAAWALEYAGIVMNRNTVPFDTASAFYPSGIRLGTPAVTTRGMKEQEMKQIATWMVEVVRYSQKWQLPKEKKAIKQFRKQFLADLAQDKYLQSVKKKVIGFAKKFPLYKR